MLPVFQLLNEFFGDSTLVQQQPENLLLEKLFELVPVECRCTRELIFTPKATIRDENMKMRVERKKIPKCLDGDYGPGH